MADVQNRLRGCRYADTDYDSSHIKQAVVWLDPRLKIRGRFTMPFPIVHSGRGLAPMLPAVLV